MRLLPRRSAGHCRQGTAIYTSIALGTSSSKTSAGLRTRRVLRLVSADKRVESRGVARAEPPIVTYYADAAARSAPAPPPRSIAGPAGFTIAGVMPLSAGMPRMHTAILRYADRCYLLAMERLDDWFSTRWAETRPPEAKSYRLRTSAQMDGR